MKTIDVKGLKCPMPLIETRKALKEIDKDESLKIIVDRENPKNNIVKFLSDNGMQSEVNCDGEVFEIIVIKKEKNLDDKEVNKCCSNNPTDKT